MSLLPNPKNSNPIPLMRWLRLNLVLLGIVLLASWSPLLSTLSQKLNDFYYWMRGPLPVSTQVAMVLIDDATLEHYGRWPWPRRQLGQLITATAQQHPRAIGLDVLLSEAEDEANDAALEQAIRDAPNVVLASKISSSPGSAWADPLPRFMKAAKGVGHVQATTDFDGLCRSLLAQEPNIDGPRPAFALKLAELLQPQLTSLEEAPAQRGAGLEQVVAHPLLIDFRQQFDPKQTPPPFVAVPASDLLAGKSFAGLAGKAVLIGFGSIEVSDRMMTPVSNQLQMPGVEINANVTDMLVSGRSLTHIGAAAQLLLMVLLSALSLWLVVRYPGARGLLLLAALLVGIYLAAYFQFIHFHRLLSYGPLLVAGVLAAPLAQLENLLIVDREVTSRLRQLYQTIQPHWESTRFAPGGTSALRWPAGHLHWKLAALKELQAELSSLYAFNQTLLESMREGLAVYGADGRLRFSNTTWKKFCERQDVRLEKLGGIEDFAGGWREVAELPPDAPEWIEREVPRGEELWLFRAARLPWTSFAEAGALLVMAEDITARRQRDQARSEALSFVTHELRTPLISIQGFSELLMRYPNSPASSEAPETIFRETNRLVAMINTYLEVLRLDAGARPLRLARASARSMAEHVEKVVRPLAAAAHIPVRVEVEAPEGDQDVVCDETLISGALLNLVSNAIKYGAQGSEVLLRVGAQEKEVEFEVRNSGPAIPESELKHIFERFYRPSRSEAIPGWGLGLSFVRRICQQHGGTIHVSSNELQGTSFAFTLPRGAMEVSEVAT